MEWPIFPMTLRASPRMGDGSFRSQNSSRQSMNGSRQARHLLFRDDSEPCLRESWRRTPFSPPSPPAPLEIQAG